MVITIDGPAGAGKSTVARRLARELNLKYLNSGTIYRAVTLLVLERGGRFEDRGLVEDVIRGLDLRLEEGDTPPGAGELPEPRVVIGDREVSRRLTDPDVTSAVYRIANDGAYRALLVDLQRRFAEDGVVAEGRDMGTVIFPDAESKVYLDASPAERARRRYRELESRSQDRDERGRRITYEDVLASIVLRDERDTGREHAPLRVPAGALVVQTDELTVEDVLRKVLEHVKKQQSNA